MFVQWPFEQYEAIWNILHFFYFAKMQTVLFRSSYLHRPISFWAWWQWFYYYTSRFGHCIVQLCEWRDIPHQRQCLLLFCFKECLWSHPKSDKWCRIQKNDRDSHIHRLPIRSLLEWSIPYLCISESTTWCFWSFSKSPKDHCSMKIFRSWRVIEKDAFFLSWVKMILIIMIYSKQNLFLLISQRT